VFASAPGFCFFNPMCPFLAECSVIGSCSGFCVPYCDGEPVNGSLVNCPRLLSEDWFTARIAPVVLCPFTSEELVARPVDEDSFERLEQNAHIGAENKPDKKRRGPMRSEL